MFDLIGAGPLMIPWLGPVTGFWHLAWQSPTTGFALLACLPTVAVTGFFLVTRTTTGATAEPVTGPARQDIRKAVSGDRHGQAVA
jgi:hypothetical protein